MDRKIYLMVAVILAALSFLLPGAGSAAPALIGSIADAVYRPSSIAVDSQGNLYATETANNMFKVYNRKGALIKQFQTPRPMGVAVDASGYIYIGSTSRSAVDIFGPDYNYVRSLGKGPGEIVEPVSIAVDGERVYVLDSGSSTVRIYDASTAKFLFSFGGSGNTDGLFNAPMALALDDAAGEIFVADLRQTPDTGGGLIEGAKIQVFDKTGAFRRSFGDYGFSGGKIGKPSGLALDGSGNVFVADILQGAVLSFDAVAGTFNNAALYKTVSSKPLDVAIGKNKIAYVPLANDLRKIDVYGLDGYTTMDTAPAALAFTSKQLTPNAEAQTVTIANTGNGSLGWTAAADSDWITLDAATGTAGPNSTGSLAVGTNNADLKADTYHGVVTVTSDFGQIDRIPVTFTVTPAATIAFSNGSVAIEAKKGKTPPAQPITIDVQNAESLSWDAISDSDWLAITPAKGTTTTTSALSIIDMDKLAPGSYTGHITLSAPTAIGDGSRLTVTLTVKPGTKISVASNIPEARFTVVSTAATYTGSGTAWSVEDVPLGEYTVTFDAVSGYRKPLAQTKSLIDEEIALSGYYRSHAEIAGRTNIIVGKGAHPNNDSLVRIYRNDGAPAAEIMAFGPDSRSGTTVASADIDGDGVAELVAERSVGADHHPSCECSNPMEQRWLSLRPLQRPAGSMWPQAI